MQRGDISQLPKDTHAPPWHQISPGQRCGLLADTCVPRVGTPWEENPKNTGVNMSSSAWSGSWGASEI